MVYKFQGILSADSRATGESIKRMKYRRKIKGGDQWNGGNTMKTKMLYLAVRTALLISLFCLLNPGWLAMANGAGTHIVKWDNSGGGPHDVYHMYSVSDQGVWNTSLDAYGADRQYTNSTFSDAYFDGVTAAIIPMPNRGSAGYTAAEATAIKDFVDDGGRVLLTGYYDKKYWDPASTNRVADKFGVEFILTDGTYEDTRMCQVKETTGNYYEDEEKVKVVDFNSHMITDGLTQYFARGGSLDVSGSDAKVLAYGSDTAYYDLNDTAGTWVNGSDIVFMAVIENSNGGGIIFSYTPYILRHEYTALHGVDNIYNGSKLPGNIAEWLVEGFPEAEDDDSPGFEAFIVLLILVPLAIPVLRRRRQN